MEKQADRATKTDDARLAFWEGRFPGHAEAFMGILHPFYDWKPELNPALPNLKSRAKTAIFWKKIKGVRAFHRSEAALLRASLRVSFEASLWASLGASLGESLELSLGVSLGASLGPPLRTSLRASLGPSLGDSLWASLVESLGISLGFILVGMPNRATMFHTLLDDLWSRGNFPVGFDAENNLLVLVAD